MPPRGIEPATPCFPARHSNHSAKVPVEDVLLKLVVYFFYATTNQHVWLCIEIDFGYMCIGTKGVWGGQRGHVSPHFQKCVIEGGVHKPTWAPHYSSPSYVTVRQNQHFFYQYRCYLLLFTDLCMGEPNHNKFHTCIVARVDWL